MTEKTLKKSSLRSSVKGKNFSETKYSSFEFSINWRDKSAYLSTCWMHLPWDPSAPNRKYISSYVGKEVL